MAVRDSHQEMAKEFWGYLVKACENTATCVAWDRNDPRWETVRRVLLRAAEDSEPASNDENDDNEEGMMSWGWPAPRLDAARGLPFLALRVGDADEAVTSVLRKLARDPSDPLRFNLAERLAVLAKPAPNLMWELLETFVTEERRFTVLIALAGSLERLWARDTDRVIKNLEIIAKKTVATAPPQHEIHATLARVHLFHFLQTGHPVSEAFIAALIAECHTPRASHALKPQLHNCRAGGWLTIGDAVTTDPEGDKVRFRTWEFFSKLLSSAQAKLRQAQEALVQLGAHAALDSEAAKPFEEKRKTSSHLVDAVAMQLYFASGAFSERTKRDEQRLSYAQMRRFWREGAALFTALATEIHPHTAYYLVQTFNHLLPYAPREIFLLAARSICSSAKAGFQYESLAVGEVVKLIQRVLADHRDLFKPGNRSDSECLAALLEVLDLFVEAGWAEARQLTHRLEEIYR